MGWYLFPIKPGTKRPAFEGWHEQSTDDPVQVEKWRDDGYDLGVDCEKSNITGVDLDGAAGLATGAGMDLPSTYTMRTPRGGKHLYYRGQAPSSVQKLGYKVDTRGIGGLLVWEADGYEVIEERGLAPLPNWIVPALNIRKDRKPSAGVSLDTETNVKRGFTYLSVLKPVVQGEGADARTFEVAAALRDLGISEERSIDMMLEHYDCQPQDERFEAFITRKVQNAWAYGQNEEGAQAFDFDPLTRFAAVEYSGSTIDEKQSRFRLWSLAEARLRPKPSFLFDGILPARSFGVAYGPQETGKTWLLIDMAMRIALGWSLDGEQINRPRDVVFFAGEGFEDIVHSRCDAWCDYHAVPRDPPRFHLMENFPNVVNEDEIDDAVAEICKRAPDLALLVVDTYARAMAEGGLSENDPLDVMKFVRQMEVLKRGFQCTILAIHHAGKDLERQARGSNALLAAADFGFEITADWSVMALRLSCAKMKAAKRFEPLFYEAQPHNDSLVIRGITASAYKSLTQVEDSFSSRAVGAALAKLLATGPDRAVHVHVLASSLYVAQISEPELEVQAKVDRIARKLTALGKGRLEQYVSKAGWHFPE